MTMIHNDDALGFFLAQMATKPTAADRVELFQNAVIEQGGDFTTPAFDGGRGSHLVEVQLFGIHDAGQTTDEAVLNWTAKAMDHMERKRLTGAAERMVLSDMRGLSVEDLRAAGERVRLYSQDMAAIAAARRIEMMIANGRAA
ncbi:hypothetical protein [Defluviimonas sp. SAOS-178_SWC]|uniref:hypothetical protein n=1 Tax=Defluviimonas sp. SAOS-178_SWC TaxID=3121287 RepID=UPI003221D6E1